MPSFPRSLGRPRSPGEIHSTLIQKIPSPRASSSDNGPLAVHTVRVPQNHPPSLRVEYSRLLEAGKTEGSKQNTLLLFLTASASVWGAPMLRLSQVLSVVFYWVGTSHRLFHRQVVEF